jgi:hypothetical protein
MDLDFEKVELCFIYDNDDEFTERSLMGFSTKDKKCVFVKRDRSEFLNRDYYNKLASIAKGKYFWGIGDDVRFCTPNFDKILEEHIETYLKDKPDRIAYISVHEEGSTAQHPCFPLITREAFEAVGEYHCSDLMSWGSDRILYEIYSPLNRCLYIPNITIKHLSYHDGTGEFDETAKSMKERFFRDPNAHNKVSMYKVPQYIKKIERVINEKRIS